MKLQEHLDNIQQHIMAEAGKTFPPINNLEAIVDMATEFIEDEQMKIAETAMARQISPEAAIYQTRNTWATAILYAYAYGYLFAKKENVQ